MYKDIVDQIHEEKAKSDSNSSDLARTLNVLAKTVFGDMNRFIFELIQNADDAALADTLEVKFQLLDNYIIFSHNGNHFTADDVKGISGMGNRASNKDKNVEKTGYKGIGFKSVFGSSDYAHILSGGTHSGLTAIMKAMEVQKIIRGRSYPSGQEPRWMKSLTFVIPCG